jgi:hypothetical protein
MTESEEDEARDKAHAQKRRRWRYSHDVRKSLVKRDRRGRSVLTGGVHRDTS